MSDLDSLIKKKIESRKRTLRAQNPNMPDSVILEEIYVEFENVAEKNQIRRWLEEK